MNSPISRRIPHVVHYFVMHDNNVPLPVYYCQSEYTVDGIIISEYKNGMRLLNTTQAAERLGISVRRVRALIEDGTLNAHQIGREYAIEESALDAVTVYRKPGRPPDALREKAAKKAARRKK